MLILSWFYGLMTDGERSGGGEGVRCLYIVKIKVRFNVSDTLENVQQVLWKVGSSAE